MIFNYKAIGSDGDTKQGTIEAATIDTAIGLLQKRGLVISSIKPELESSGSFLQSNIAIFSRITNKDIVILSRQIATLFGAQVSALRVFTLLASQVENMLLRKSIEEIVSDIQGGSAISAALAKHPLAFSDFYVNMVRAGEESGKLDEVFNYLADYLDRTYEVTSKAKNALIYPAFVIATFLAVMILMFTVIIPKIGAILEQSGQQLPIYTRVILAISGFFVHFGFLLGAAILIGLFFLWKYTQTTEGKLYMDDLKIRLPYMGDLFQKLYLSRIADNMSTLVSSGVPMLKALQISSSVVGNDVYRSILDKALEDVKGGKPLSTALSEHTEQIPPIFVQMIKVGEETGELSKILKTIATFYEREVARAVDTVINLIEPVMIVVLGLGVGILVAAILVPIYNISSSF